MIRFSHGAASSVGRVRRVNEDSLVAVPPLYAVADGMGGHGSGDVASRLAVEVLARCAELRPLFTEAVLAALEEANRAIIEHAGVHKMGTTVAGLAGLETVGGDHLMVFNVGDSRVYRLAGERVQQLTVDHSQVQELVLAGVITSDQARNHPRRNIVTRALGSAPALRADHWVHPVVDGDRFLICSDGLFTELPDAVIVPLLAVGGPQQAAEALVAAACDAGGHDNVTVLVVDVNPGPPMPARAPARPQPQARAAQARETPTRVQPDGAGPARQGGSGSRRDPGRTGGPGEPPVNVGLIGLGLIDPD